MYVSLTHIGLDLFIISCLSLQCCRFAKWVF